MQKTNNKHNLTNLSKSASQSSILTIFKNTFSPFAIRKWRSKSRDKIIQKTELTTFDVCDHNNKPQVKQRPISPDMLNHQQPHRQHNSIKNSHNNLKQQLVNSQAPPLPMNDPVVTQDSNKKFQKNQLTPNQIKLRTANKTNIMKKFADANMNDDIDFSNNQRIDIYQNNSIKIETVSSTTIDKVC